jgi:uncharacterized protein YndB with AHSA1/START domain
MTFDVKQQVAAVSRRQETRDDLEVQTISQAYDTSLEDLWEAVTTAERLSRWFLPVTGDLVEGGSYQFKDHVGGQITKCDKPNGYDVTWVFGDDTSWVSVRLTAEGPSRTRFTLEHAGHAKPEFWEQFGPGATGLGYDGALSGLFRHLESPETAITPEEGMAWAQTDEGKEFMRLCADGWVEADIAAGADPVLARAKGDRTYGAYTGAA